MQLGAGDRESPAERSERERPEPEERTGVGCYEE